MWNHAKNSMKQLKWPTSLISHWQMALLKSNKALANGNRLERENAFSTPARKLRFLKVLSQFKAYQMIYKRGKGGLKPQNRPCLEVLFRYLTWTARSKTSFSRLRHTWLLCLLCDKGSDASAVKCVKNEFACFHLRLKIRNNECTCVHSRRDQRMILLCSWRVIMKQ